MALAVRIWGLRYGIYGLGFEVGVKGIVWGPGVTVVVHTLPDEPSNMSIFRSAWELSQASPHRVTLKASAL